MLGRGGGIKCRPGTTGGAQGFHHLVGALQFRAHGLQLVLKLPAALAGTLQLCGGLILLLATTFQLLCVSYGTKEHVNEQVWVWVCGGCYTVCASLAVTLQGIQATGRVGPSAG